MDYFNDLVASLRTLTGQNNEMVCQNLQISGVCGLGRHNSNSKKMNDDNSYPVGSTVRYVMKLCTGSVKDNNEWFVLGGTESVKGCNSLFLMVLGQYRAYVPLYIEWRISTGDMVRCHRSLTDRLQTLKDRATVLSSSREVGVEP